MGGNFHGAGPEQNAFATTIGADSDINADAINSGNGGRIAVWSDGDTSVAGMLTARGGTNSGDGGFIETSGHHLSIAEGAQVNTLASHGKTGAWLIDPQDFTVAASGGDITGTALSTNLGTTNVEVQSSTGGTLGSGDVNVNDAVSWSANTILTLTAANDVNINADITATGDTAGLIINPDTALDFSKFVACAMRTIASAPHKHLVPMAHATHSITALHHNPREAALAHLKHVRVADLDFQLCRVGIAHQKQLDWDWQWWAVPTLRLSNCWICRAERSASIGEKGHARTMRFAAHPTQRYFLS